MVQDSSNSTRQFNSKRIWGTFLFMLVLTLTQLNFVSAFEFDNIKSFEKDIGEYGKVEIRNSILGLEWFQLDKVSTIELKTNTEKCIDYLCQAIKEITMYDSGKLIDEIRFIDMETNKETTIENYNFKVKINNIWTDYNYETLPGNNDGIIYEVKLEGKLKPFQYVDWQIKAQGEWIEEWAVWSDNLNSGLLAYWTFNDNSTSVEDVVSGISNATVINQTGGIDFPTGLVNQAANFTPNAYMNIPDFSELIKATDWSMGGWVNLKKLDNYNFFSISDGTFSEYFIFMRQGNELRLQGTHGGGTDIDVSTSGNKLAGISEWIFIGFTINSTGNALFINGTQSSVSYASGSATTDSATVSPSVLTGVSTATLGAHDIGGLANFVNASLDEFFYYDRSLTDLEWAQLYNEGNGLGFQPETNFNTLISPENNLQLFETASLTTLFNCSYSGALNVSNISLFTNQSTAFTSRQFTSNLTSQLTNETSATFALTLDNTVGANVTWTCEACDINNTCQTAKTNRTIGISPINFGLCQTGNTQSYINLTFKNETIAAEDVSATISSTWNYWLDDGSLPKTLAFSNASENMNYSFCFTPSNLPLNVNYTINYNNAESQQRTARATALLTNITTLTTLYLLPSSAGLFSPFQTVNSVGDAISGVLATITRTLGGSTITVTTTSTDSSGFLTVFLNPDITYSAVFSKTGFPDNSFSFTPTTTTRTVTMGGGAGTINVLGNGTLIAQNTSYTILPSNSSLNNNTDYTFSFAVSSSQSITLISMNITNSTGGQLTFQSNSGTGTVSSVLNTGNNTKLIGTYILQTSSETLSLTKIWIIGSEFEGSYSIFTQLTLFMDYNFTDFIRLLITLCIIIAVLIFMTAGEITDTSESKIAVATLLIWAFSVVGWMNTGIISNTEINPLGQFSNQYGIAILSTGISVYFIFRRIFIRRI